MLGKIQPRYRIQAAKLLRICHQSRLLEISECIFTLVLALIDGKQMDIEAIQTSVNSLTTRSGQSAQCWKGGCVVDAAASWKHTELGKHAMKWFEPNIHKPELFLHGRAKAALVLAPPLMAY